MATNSAQTNAKFTVKNLFNIEDWVCVVSGGATGIGLMIAQAYANNGARVYIASRRQEALDTAVKSWGSTLAHPKGKLIPLQVDITDKASIKKLVEEISSKESHVDVLVNNAGVSEGTTNVEAGDESAEKLSEAMFAEGADQWEQTWKTNVMGHFFTTAAFLPLLSAASRSKPNHTAAVINTASISGITRTSQHHFKYNASKAASIHLTQLLAQELSRPGVRVRVNAISPGIFPSEMTAEESDETNKSKIPAGESYGEKKGIPANRPGAEEDMAQAALYLAVNQYAYNSNVVVDGGYLLGNP
jgi:NAD(P)-dependent dehydrogenase (short-subunit alcohol dehydrogenase family)